MLDMSTKIFIKQQNNLYNFVKILTLTLISNIFYF